MFKNILSKKEIKKLNSNFEKVNYSGMSGYLFSLGHKNLEKNLEKSEYKNVLEIGAGTEPQLKYINHKYNKYTVLEMSDYAIEHLQKKYKKIHILKYDGVNLPFSDNSFDRIILSHCLEHIQNFEVFLEILMKKLKRGGVLSLSQPTDPGFLWRFGRYLRQAITLKDRKSREEYYYIMANEHINSVFNIFSVLKYKYKYKMKESYVPFKIKSLDFNLFYNVHIKK